MSVVLVVAAVILNNLILYFWKPWLGAYGAEKGKNLARKEDLEKILSEVRAVTVATKKIEATISIDVWDRQKKWEIKRDAFFEAVKELATAEDALTGLDSTYAGARLNPENASMQLDRKVEANERWGEARLSFQKAFALATLVSDGDVGAAFDIVHMSMLQMGSDIMANKPNAFLEAYPKFSPELYNLRAAIRRELGIL